MAQSQPSLALAEHMLCWNLSETCHETHCDSAVGSSSDRKAWAILPVLVQASTSARAGKFCARQQKGRRVCRSVPERGQEQPHWCTPYPVPFPGEMRRHRFTLTCASDLADTDLNRPVAVAGAYPGARKRMCPFLEEPARVPTTPIRMQWCPFWQDCTGMGVWIGLGCKKS